jgi:beta-galactosidase
MRRVQIKENQVSVGGRKVPLLSGEVHYWRLNPGYWPAVLNQVREMGINVISTYVPWDYHEVKRGHFDFTGETNASRDLEGFLRLTKREGFWVIIRPGPYIYSEWPNDGIPTYAHQFHRLHPQYLKYAQVYLKKVCAVIKPFLATRKSGHIILLQADNEIDPWPDTFGQQYGLSNQPGMFQEFLDQKYEGNVHELNRAWGTQYSHFKEAGPYIACMFKEERGVALKGDPELRRNLDYFEFKYDYSYRCAKWNVEAYRSLGINVPIYLNLYPFFYAHDWAKMQSVCDMVGVDLYPSSELSEDEYEQRKFIDKIRFLRRVSKVAYIAEFASGVWHARHYESGVLTPNHYRLIALSALLGGAVGWNWYMLVNRDNWYMSPINELAGRRHELYEVFKGLVDLYHKMEPYRLTKMTDVAVTFNPTQYAARTLPSDNKILTALYDADIDYDLFNPATGAINKKIVFYSGNQWLSRRAHENLLSYVEAGGVLVAFQDYPRKSEIFEPCQLLGFHDPDQILFEFKRSVFVSLNKGSSVEVVSTVFCFDRVSGTPIRSSLGNYGEGTIGYIKKVGKGKILHLGVQPTKELLIEILKYFKVNIYSNSSTKDVKTAVFNRGKTYFIVAVNNGREDKNAVVNFILPDRKFKNFSVLDILAKKQSKQHTHHRGKALLTIELPRKDGRVFEIKLK